MPNIQGQLPLRALRDLLGLVRVMYADAVATHASPIELEELRAIGESLHTALDMAAKTKPNTMGHRAAWVRAEQATKELGALVGKYSSLESTVRTAGERVLGAPTPVRFDPNEKIRERTKRG
ncbi:MAG: hypothetical protein ABI548_22520 [Polyangiaceae bacterium]